MPIVGVCYIEANSSERGKSFSPEFVHLYPKICFPSQLLHALQIVSRQEIGVGYMPRSWHRWVYCTECLLWVRVRVLLYVMPSTGASWRRVYNSSGKMRHKINMDANRGPYMEHFSLMLEECSSSPLNLHCLFVAAPSFSFSQHLAGTLQDAQHITKQRL